MRTGVGGFVNEALRTGGTSHSEVGNANSASDCCKIWLFRCKLFGFRSRFLVRFFSTSKPVRTSVAGRPDNPPVRGKIFAGASALGAGGWGNGRHFRAHACGTKAVKGGVYGGAYRPPRSGGLTS